MANSKDETNYAKLYKKGIIEETDFYGIFPRRIYDCTKFVKPCLETCEKVVTVCGSVASIYDKYKNNRDYTIATIERTDGIRVMVTWFGYNTITKEHGMGKMANRTAVIKGVLKPSDSDNLFFMTNPAAFFIFPTGNDTKLVEGKGFYTTEKGKEKFVSGIISEYPAVSGISKYWMDKKIAAVKENYKTHENEDEDTRGLYGDFLPYWANSEYSLMPMQEVYESFYASDDIEKVRKARERLIYNQLIYFATKLKMRTSATIPESNINAQDRSAVNTLIQSLPYKLTDDQYNTTMEVISKIAEKKTVNALIQGDVSCGKTIVAFLVMLYMASNGYQSLLLAPAVVLAEQHYKKLTDLTESLGYKSVLMVSSMSAKEKKERLADIKSGRASFIIGTTSAIADDVEFSNLGLVAIDEEQKFGVEQRERVYKKTDNIIHTISLSATPIPRTLANNLYGDLLDLYSIKQMPAGRIPQTTYMISKASDLKEKLTPVLESGHQCYVICSRVDFDENAKEQGILSVEEAKRTYERLFPRAEIGVVTGKDSGKRQKEILDDFRSGKTQILISTTVVEVGVDVKNASAIVIHNAERFGLSSLHQLRGRVGRGNEASQCILVSTKDTSKLEIMCQTTDGFKIAMRDLDLRKQGNPIGIEQSGSDKRVELLMGYPEIYANAKEIAKRLISEKAYKKLFLAMEENYWQDIQKITIFAK